MRRASRLLYRGSLQTMSSRDERERGPSTYHEVIAVMRADEAAYGVGTRHSDIRALREPRSPASAPGTQETQLR